MGIVFQFMHREQLALIPVPKSLSLTCTDDLDRLAEMGSDEKNAPTTLHTPLANNSWLAETL